MVSWTRAFKAAALFIGYSIIWSIIGTALIVLGIRVAGLTTLTLRPNGFQFADGIIVMVLGFVIIILGNMATFFKVNTDIIEESIHGEPYQEEPLVH
jgi:uncharacterized membrane protein